MEAKKVDTLEEHLEVEIGQMKYEISDLQTQVLDLKKDISAIHEKMDEKFFSMGEMLKKVLEGQTIISPSEGREGTDNQGDGKNPKPIRQRGDQEVETRKGEEKIPLLDLIPREEQGRGYEDRHEEYTPILYLGRPLHLPSSCLILERHFFLSRENQQGQAKSTSVHTSMHQDRCMADPDLDYGLSYDEQGFACILHSTFFDINPCIDHTVEEYVEHILNTLVEAIEEQFGTVQWRITSEP
ncbi:hypothetical protein MA16_Dca011774 [Dendrobium catenatum]|uniref:Uncharacterized protein n=1 Tax=Dendrobium catenatum TaxID=906689 RepID=A0A2I0WEG9_9ASPA|nr:hypothetical protein MA16_Dca011774 [Dendrobium catenatum]